MIPAAGCSGELMRCVPPWLVVPVGLGDRSLRATASDGWAPRSRLGLRGRPGWTWRLAPAQRQARVRVGAQAGRSPAV